MSENQTPQTETVKIPEWITYTLSAYQDGIAHAFVLFGNVNDYVLPGIRLNSLITQSLVKRDIILFYNRSRGITFPSSQMERKFRKLVGLAAAESAAPANAALAALAASRGQQGGQEPPLPRTPAEALPVIEQAMREAEPRSMAVVIEFAETLLPDAPVSMLSPDDRTNLVTVSRWGSDAQLGQQGQFIFLVTSSLEDMAPAIRQASNKFEAVEVPFPSFDDRLNYIRWFLTDSEIETELSPLALANMTAGLNLMGIEDVFLRAQASGKLTAEMVKNRKRAIIRSEYGDVLEVLEPKGGFELIGGMEYIKEYFTRSIINPILSGRLSRVPKGVMMLGPAGTGKSIFAKSVAFESKMNSVKLNVGGQIASMWQGEGERKLAKALRGILTFAPTIVFIDELDQTVSRGQGNNQQDSRIFQMLLEFMAEDENRGKVVFLAASNRPDLMDAALLRAGRFDDKLAFLIPDSAERESIFKVMAKYEYGLGDVEIPAEAVNLTDGYTGAEISAVVRKASILVEDEGLNISQALTDACRRIKASTRAIEQMTALALENISDADLVPPKYREQIGEAAPEVEVPAPTRRQRREL